MKRRLVFVSACIALAALAAPVLAADADGDGYDDATEWLNGYDPFGPGRPSDADADGDGLKDFEEKLYGTSLAHRDTDGDGYADGLEVANGYDPLAATPLKLKKRVVISLASQRLTAYEGARPVARHAVSTGRPGAPTPKGTFAINNKAPRAWSARAKLWMPWWMAFKGSTYGIHELPEWPGGRKEGESHLGTPVSAGCVRLGVGPAKSLYDWAEIGTEVVVTD